MTIFKLWIILFICDPTIENKTRAIKISGSQDVNFNI